MSADDRRDAPSEVPPSGDDGVPSEGPEDSGPDAVGDREDGDADLDEVDGDVDALAEDSDDLGLDDDLDDATATDRPVDPAAGTRRSPARWFLALAGATWAVVAFMRCGPTGPTTQISTAPTDEAPAPAAAETPAPSPAATTPVPTPAPATPPTPEPEDTPAPIDPSWAQGLPPIAEVTYTVRHGGSLKNVANLFKIFHHEVEALNPGRPLDQELPPNTKVVVHRRDDKTPSESIGFPGDGSLEGAIPMPEGPGRVVKATPWKTWGTAHTVTILDAALSQWDKRYPDAQPILVGNLSARGGGRLRPHSSHRSGRDVDLSYPQRAGVYDELNWREMNAENLDAAATWNLIKLLIETDQVEYIFIDTSLQKLLHKHAAKHRVGSKAQVRSWLEYPRSVGASRAVVQHVRGHTDHMHVRFRCPPGATRCKTRPPH